VHGFTFNMAAFFFRNLTNLFILCNKMKYFLTLFLYLRSFERLIMNDISTKRGNVTFGMSTKNTYIHPYICISWVLSIKTKVLNKLTWMQRNVRMLTSKINAEETITSMALWGPCFWRYERTESHVLILRTLLSRKCGSSDLLARRDEVKWQKYLAYKNR